jgi:hypothetical protein
MGSASGAVRMSSPPPIRLQLSGNALTPEDDGSQAARWMPGTRVRVRMPTGAPEALHPQHDEEIELALGVRDNAIEMSCELPRLHASLEFEEPGLIVEFARKYLQDLVGILLAAILSGRREDILWLDADRGDRLWCLGLTWTASGGRGAVVRRPRPPEETVEPFIMPDRQIASDLFGHLWDSRGLALPEFFPFRREDRGGVADRLTVKMDPSVSNFYLIPVNLFWREGLGGFRRYSDVGWIVTSRTFLDDSLRLLRLERDMNDVVGFLSHAVVIINTYPEPPGSEVAEACETGMRLVLEVMDCLQDVDFVGKRVSLPCVVNPGENELRQLLLDPCHQYLFADFHVEDGLWQLAGREAEPTSSSFPLDFLKPDSLNHVQLLRVFHCCSVFDPFDLRAGSWIAKRLLDAGAFHVEGSPFFEDFRDYLCSLLKVFCGQKALLFVIYAKCVSRSRDFRGLMDSVSQFMRSQGWPSEPFENT